jgi:putative ABC transport system permease protein
MIRSYIKIALRSFTKNFTFSLINLFGLSIAFALFILLSLYITSELTTDSHLENIENIYILHEKNSNHTSSGGMFAEYVNERYPEVKQVCRTFYWSDVKLFIDDDHFIKMDNFGLVDSNYFKIFHSEVILGNLDDALKGNNGIVLTETTSKALFGDQNPLGKTVSLGNEYDFIVNAVIPDLPKNSTYLVECFLSVERLLETHEGLLTSPGNWSTPTIVEVHENTNIPLLEEKLSKDLLEEYGRDTNWGLFPYSKLYFDGPDAFRNGNKQFVMLFLGVAIFILLIACINYINLTTARAGNRAREVGIRKVVGAYKQKLIRQFLTESIFLIFVSLILGFLLAELCISEFNTLAQSELQVKVFYAFPYNIIFISGSILLGILSGLYPAFALTSFKTIEVIKGKVARSKGGTIARKVLMVFQFVISMVMIVGTIVIYLQINYVKNVNLGFNKENVIHLRTNDNAFMNAQDFKTEILTIPGVEKVSFSRGIPGAIGNGMYDERTGQEVQMRHLSCDPDFMDLFDLELVSGRNFSWADSVDIRKAYMINEAAVKKYGWEDPYEIKLWGLKLIGVVKDFNFKSLHQPIGPLFITYHRSMAEINIRISGMNQREVIAKIEKAWLKKYPETPFDFRFVDQIMDQQYKEEERLGTIISYFSIFALIIASMGLLGMTSFMIQQRHREIGIRKVHGSAVSQIIKMLSFEFVKWVILAFIISTPLSYYLMNKWLSNNFTFRVDLDWWIFVISGVVVVFISLITVSIQSYRAAIMNPVDSLRYE